MVLKVFFSLSLIRPYAGTWFSDVAASRWLRWRWRSYSVVSCQRKRILQRPVDQPSGTSMCLAVHCLCELRRCRWNWRLRPRNTRSFACRHHLCTSNAGNKNNKMLTISVWIVSKWPFLSTLWNTLQFILNITPDKVLQHKETNHSQHKIRKLIPNIQSITCW